MNRNSLLEMSGRVMHTFVRATLNKANVSSMLAELHIDGMNSDGRSRVEQLQNFGFSASPLPRDEDDKKQGGAQQQGGIEQPKGPAAEAIIAFIGGQRNHPVCIALDDRRHRPLGLKPGENAQYDDQGQMTLLRRTGLFLLSLDTEEKDKDGKTKKTERMVSLRHVEKKKQERGKVGQAGAAAHDVGGLAFSPTARAAAQAAEDKKKEDFKHEGETVNTEVRASKSKVEFRTGDTSVGYYDKDNKTWLHTSGGDETKSAKVTDKHVHIRYGNNTLWVDDSGVWSSVPIQLKPDPESTLILKDPVVERIEKLEARVRELETQRGE